MLLKKQGYSSSFFLEVNKSFVYRKFCLVFLWLDSLKGLFEVELRKWEAHIFIKRSCSQSNFPPVFMFCSFSFSFPFVWFFLLLHLSFFSLFASARVLAFVALINIMTESSCYWQCFDLILYCQCARSEHGDITSKILEEKFLVYLEDTSSSRISAWQRVGVLRKQNAHS